MTTPSHAELADDANDLLADDTVADDAAAADDPAADADEAVRDAPLFESADAMYVRCSLEELEEYAGLAEHPAETVRRLRAAGEWDGPGGAKEHFEAELALHVNSGDPRRQKNAPRLAFERVQEVPKWRPPADAVSVPTIFEQRAWGDQVEADERAREQAEAHEQEEQLGCRPPKTTAEEKAHFRKLDEDFEAGRRRRDPVSDLAWVYEHLYDDDTTAFDAPSRGAWSMLFFAKAYPDRFYGTVWPPAEKELQRRNETNKRGVVSEGEQKTRDELRGMICEAEAHQRRLDAAEASGR